VVDSIISKMVDAVFVQLIIKYMIMINFVDRRKKERWRTMLIVIAMDIIINITRIQILYLQEWNDMLIKLIAVHAQKTLGVVH